jgi:competence protein ComEC
MAKRPMCLLCFLMVLSLCVLELMGIPLIKGNPLPLNVQEQIEAHPGSMICGEVEQRIFPVCLSEKNISYPSVKKISN